MGDEGTHIAEKLVATIARESWTVESIFYRLAEQYLTPWILYYIIRFAGAFYTDNYVVLVDALVREKYIRQEELGPRLKLPNEEVRKMVVQVGISTWYTDKLTLCC